MRIFLWLSFDGTAYHGWQIQPNGMSVQEKVQQCLSTLLSQPIAVTGAGRTDAGVHARTMVCHFDIDKELDTDQLCYRLNRILPRDISCGRAEPVETHWKLDFEMMNEAALWLTTQDDFKAFCKAGADNKTTLCQVTTAQWVSTSPTTWYFEIAANRFLRNMVRAVVGTLFEVGRHRMTLQQFHEVVATGTRSDAGESMPAHGLFLWDIVY